MIEAVTIPEISENVESGKVVSVLVAEGDSVDVDDVLIELETDKAVVEIPSTVKGEVVELLVEEGDEKNVGDVIARIDTDAEEKDEAGEGGADADTAAPASENEDQAAGPEEEDARTEATGKETTDQSDRDAKGERSSTSSRRETPPPAAAGDDRQDPESRRGPVPASPSIRRMARELGIDIHDVHAAAKGGRITESDVKSFVRRQLRSGGTRSEIQAQQPEMPDFSRWGTVETEELPTVRRLTAQSMARSWETVPHVTQFDQADIVRLEAFVEDHAEAVSRQGGKLTVTAVLVKVVADALKRFPRFNASIDMAGQRIIFKQYRHIGIAVATSRGLLVPVVRDADRKSITEIAVEVTDLADRARNKKIKPEEMEGGTFTVSNQGGIGGTQFTPIVFWPQVAILGMSRASVVPVWVKDTFAPRTVLPLSLSYDHRIIDGADAAAFLRWVGDCLEHPLTIVF